MKIKYPVLAASLLLFFSGTCMADYQCYDMGDGSQECEYTPDDNFYDDAVES